MRKRALITGGAGFVGSHLADELLRRGHSVRVLDPLDSQVHAGGRPSYLSKDVDLVVADVRDTDAVREALLNSDVVFHFAAAVGVGQSMYEINRYMSVNTGGTAALLQAMLDCRAVVEKIIVASSMSIYGEGSYICSKCGAAAAPPVRSVAELRNGRWDLQCQACSGVLRPTPTAETKAAALTSVYALSKRDQEELCLMYGRTYGIPVTALRFFNIFGPRQSLSNPYTGVAAIFASRLLNNRQPLVFEDGEQMRDFVSVHDIVRACVLAMERSQSNDQVINIGSGRPISIRTVAALLAESLDSEIQPVITGKYRAGDIRHCFADISKARALLGYEPKVSHSEGFRELAVWLREQQAEDKADIMMEELTAYGLTA